jgi:hypothetical protein
VSGAAAALVQIAADQVRGIHAGALEGDGHERGGRGLAVRAGDRDRPMPGGKRRERLLTLPDR